MGLKKLLKKARKAIGLPPITLKNVAKGAVAAAAGPVALGGAVLASKLKSAAVGGIKQVVRTKAAKKASEKLAKLGPVAVTPIKGSAVTMPGGAPLKKVKRAKLPRVKRRAQSANPKGSDGYYADRERVQSKNRKKVRAAPKASGKKRTPPKGGLDLKGLSASWKAAGKPGTWQGWIASNK